MPYRNAASVLPEPVGAWIRTLPPVAIAGQPCACAGVGPANARSNQPRVFGEKGARASIPSGYLGASGQEIDREDDRQHDGDDREHEEVHTAEDQPRRAGALKSHGFLDELLDL